MSAITFEEARAAARGEPAPADAHSCVDALRATVHPILEEGTPTLRTVFGSLDRELTITTPGAFVIAVLRCDERALHTSVELLAPAAKVTRHRAASVYADCWLVLSNWVVDWNRRQIKRVA